MVPLFLSTSRGENYYDSERIISFKADFHEKCGFYIAIVSDDGVVLNSGDQQPVWFGIHQLSEDFMDKEVAAFSVKECDEVFPRWESGPLKNHTFEDVLIASENGNQLFSSMSLGDVVLYIMLQLL